MADETNFFSKKPSTLIVFVHGFWGDKVDTWMHPKPYHFYFPKKIFEDKQMIESLGEFDVISFGHKSSCSDLGYSIDKIAEDLLKEIQGLDEKNSYKKIKIVAHSMGGVITKKLLVGAFDHKTVKKIDTVINLGTPHWGGNKVAKYLLKIQKVACERNDHAKELDAQDGGYLDRLNDNWRSRFFAGQLGNLKVNASAVEGDDTYIIANRTVPKYSATLNSTLSSTFPLDHVDLSKPKSTLDDLYVWVSDILRTGKSSYKLSDAKVEARRNGFDDMQSLIRPEVYKEILSARKSGDDKKALSLIRSEVGYTEPSAYVDPMGILRTLAAGYFSSKGEFKTAEELLTSRKIPVELSQYKHELREFPPSRQLSADGEWFKTNLTDLQKAISDKN